MQPPRRLPLALLAVGLIALAACSSPSASGEPSEAATNPPPSSEAASAAPSAAAELVVTFDGTVPDGWAVGEQDVPVPGNESVSLEMYPDRYVQAANCELEPEAGVGTSAEDITEALAARGGLDVSEPADVTVDGLTGLQIDISTQAESEAMTCAVDDGNLVPLLVDDLGGYVATGPGENLRVIVLDVPGGRNLVIWLWALATGDISEYEDAFMSVVDGLQIQVR